MGMKHKEKNQLLKFDEEWRKLLLDAKHLGITPAEIRHFFQLSKSTNLLYYNSPSKDK